MRAIGHFIGGREVKGTSGRTADVYEPMTGDVQAKVDLASKAEVRAAVENAAAAQPEWGATNPQRRARVMMKFLELAQRDYDKLADLLAREHGKTVPDAKGDIQRGLEVVEFACGIPHLMKGEYTEGAGPGIDIYSMRQPLGVVAGITPFNFPAMIPMWKFAPAIACGNAFILKPSERDPGVPMELAKLMIEAGLPPGILNVVNGDKEAVDAFLADRPIYLRARRRHRQAGAMFWRRQEPRHRHAGRRHGPDRRCLDRRGLRLGRRALHGNLGRSPRRQDHRRPADGETDSTGRILEDRHLDRSVGGLRSAGDARGAQSRQELRRHRHQGRRHTRGRWPEFQDAGLREGLLYGRLPVRQCHERHADLQGRDLWSGALGGARPRLQGSLEPAVRSRLRQWGSDLHP